MKSRGQSHVKNRDDLLIEVRFALKGRNTGDIRPSYHEKLGI